MKALAVLLMLALAASAQGALQSRTVEYTHGDVALEGYLVYDDSFEGKRPGVLVIHEWWGLNDYAKGRADQLAAMGYLAFAADMYGKGVRAGTPEEAGRLAGAIRSDRGLMRGRARAGLEVLRKHNLCDPDRTAAIGYCFGGGVVLELARSGAEVAGVVSFHGNLDTPDPSDAKNIKAKVLVLAGADDRASNLDIIKAFEAEMRAGGVDWQLVLYGNAVHAFSNPAAGDDPSRGAAYDERAAKRSWRAMQDFFDEIFG